jgi:hypothetical protein
MSLSAFELLKEPAGPLIAEEKAEIARLKKALTKKTAERFIWRIGLNKA